MTMQKKSLNWKTIEKGISFYHVSMHYYMYLLKIVQGNDRKKYFQLNIKFI
jgi:hypothetical protein